MKYSPDKLTLVPPHADKHWSVMGESNEDQFWKLRCLFGINAPKDSPIKRTGAFWQGGQLEPGWFMVEFWTHNQNDILEAAEFLAQQLNLPLDL